MDLTNFDEVKRIICEEGDSNISSAIDNLCIYVNDYASKQHRDYITDYMKELVEETALKLLLLIKTVKKDDACDKAAELWKQYSSLSEDNRDANSDAYCNFKAVDDEACDLDADCEELRRYIKAQNYYNFTD